MISIRTCLVAALLALPSGAVLADTVYLTNGRTVTGIVTEENGRVTIDHGCGKISIPRSFVTKIERDSPAAATTASATVAPAGSPTHATASASTERAGNR